MSRQRAIRVVPIARPGPPTLVIASVVLAGIAATGCVDARREAFSRHRAHAIPVDRVAERMDDEPPIAAILPGALELLGSQRALVAE